ncbi:hypothetical protein MASR2M29_21260 [Spirochaetota bacterium]
MQVKISSIKIKKRIRRRIKDVDQLADSMQRLGQLHPVLITRNRILISGRRRIAAAKALGWTHIEAAYVNYNDPLKRLELELEENLQRSALSHHEVANAIEKIEKLKNPGVFRRFCQALKAFFLRLFGK